MRAYGASEDDIEAVRAAMAVGEAGDEQPQAFEVYADNWRSVQAFLAVGTQWERAGSRGRRVRLVYEAVWPWIDRFVPRRRRREVFTDLQLMELAVLQADREQVGET